MKKILLILTVLIATITFTACSDDNLEMVDIKISDSQKTLSFNSDELSGELTFTAYTSWQASIAEKSKAAPDWISLNQYSGEAETVTLNISLDKNENEKSRIAVITIACGNTIIDITITQKGTTSEPAEPTEPTEPDYSKLITQITQTIQTNSGTYSGTFEPHSFEFGYDNSKLSLFHVKEHDGSTYIRQRYVYESSNWIKMEEEYSGYTNNYTLDLNADGYVKEISGDSKYKLSYNNKYISEVLDQYNDAAFRYIWENNNLKYCQRSGYDSAFNKYNTELNNKTNLDLNYLLFDLMDKTTGQIDHGYDREIFILSMAGLTGKRSKNYRLANGNDDYDNISDSDRIYTPATEPSQGLISKFDTWSVQEGDSYTYDSEAYPTSYSYTADVVTHERHYNGERTYITPKNDNEREMFTMKYGEGPWFQINIENTTTSANVTVTCNISYDK